MRRQDFLRLAGSGISAERLASESSVLEKGRSAEHTEAMRHRCECGRKCEIVPKEIPVREPEPAFCENCGREIKGPRCTRYVDYIPATAPVDKSAN